MRNFEIACSHEEIAMVLALAGGQASSAVLGWGREGFREVCFGGSEEECRSLEGAA